MAWAIVLLVSDDPIGQALGQYIQRFNEVGDLLEGVNCTALPGDDDCEYWRLVGVVPEQPAVTFGALNGNLNPQGRNVLINNHRVGAAMSGAFEFSTTLTVEAMQTRVRQRLGEVGHDRVWWVERQTDTAGDLPSKFEAV